MKQRLDSIWQRGPGFRLRPWDPIVLLLGGVAAWFLRDVEGEPGLLVLFVVGHFFLFCNVIRLHRRLELLWAGCFALAVIVHAQRGDPGFVPIALTIAPVSSLVVAAELRSSHYHGAGWQWIRRRRG